MENDEVLKADGQGSIILITTDKKATSDVRYKTIGWTVFSEDRSKSVVVPLEEYKSETHKENPDVPEGKVRTYFKVEKDVLFARIGATNKEWQRDLYTNGGNVILDGVMTIVESGVRMGGLLENGAKHWGEVYYTLSGIKNARSWADKSGLNSHFGKKLYFPPHIEMVKGKAYVMHFTVEGIPLTQYDDMSQPYELTYNNSYKYVQKQIPKYEYRGFKLGFDSTPSGSTNNGTSVEFTYDGTFANAYVYFYYERKSEIINSSQGSMNADLEAFILADDRNNSDKFDAKQGIPTSEYLYANVLASEYLANYKFAEKTGSKLYLVTVRKTYNLKWEEDEGHYEPDPENGGSRWVSNWVEHSERVTVEKSGYQVYRDYSYWVVENLDVYTIDKAELFNPALPDGKVVLEPPLSYNPVTFNHVVPTEHIKDPNTVIELGEETIDGGRLGKPSVPDPDWKNEANKLESIKVFNDTLVFNGKTVMNGGEYSGDTPDPAAIPASDVSDKYVLYKDGLYIDKTKANGLCESSGKVYYKRTGSIKDVIERPITDYKINDVVIHTPVVCVAKIPDEDDNKNYNQKINPDVNRESLILGRSFKIQLSTTGNHRDISGYSTKDYKKYTEKKEVKFPFDVYVGKGREGTFIPANKWHEIKDSDLVEFYLPIWVDEGNYDIQFREIAINAINDQQLNMAENKANKNIKNYVATDTIAVNVVGRLYGFKVTDITDYPLWESVFRTGSNTSEHSKEYYWGGSNDQDSNPRSDYSQQFTLPIMNGSHPKYKNEGVLKTGYKFKFELETIGNYYEDLDCIKITPTFFYVKKDGSGRKKVDLWYNERFNNKNNYFVKIGDDRDKLNTKYIKLGDPYRNVPDLDISKTSEILGISESTFRNQDAKLGWFNLIVLSKPLRTFVGDNTNLPSGVDPIKVKKSKQHWYGEYYLPNDLYVVPEGYDVIAESRKNNGLDGSESFWLKDGYVIVNFKIETVKDGKFSNPVLSYSSSPNNSTNMWAIEGFTNSKTDSSGKNFSLQYGDIIFYHANKRASGDYTGGGTH